MSRPLIGSDPADATRAVASYGRARCQLCALYFDLNEVAAGISGICPTCIAREGKPIQDNDPDEGGFCRPRELPEIVVARIGRAKAEAEAERMRLALLQHHQILCAIAAANLGRRPLRLFPKDQSKLAVHALDLLRQNFPDIASTMDLPILVESQ